MRKVIEASKKLDPGVKRYKKACESVEKLLNELNARSRKITLLKGDVDMGDADVSKIGGLDELAFALENAINILAKI